MRVLELLQFQSCQWKGLGPEPMSHAASSADVLDDSALDAQGHARSHRGRPVQCGLLLTGLTDSAVDGSLAKTVTLLSQSTP